LKKSSFSEIGKGTDVMSIGESVGFQWVISEATQDYINTSLSMISFFPDRSQWDDYEKENDYIHNERSQHFLRTKIRPVPIPY